MKIACTACHSTGQMDWTSGPFTCDECGGSGEIDERMLSMTTKTGDMEWIDIPVEGDTPDQFDYLCEEFEWFIYCDGDHFTLHKGVDESGEAIARHTNPEKLKSVAQSFQDTINRANSTEINPSRVCDSCDNPIPDGDAVIHDDKIFHANTGDGVSCFDGHPSQSTPMESLQSRPDQMLRVLSALVSEGHLLSPETDGGDGFTTSLFREDFKSPEDFEWFKDFILSEQ